MDWIANELKAQNKSRRELAEAIGLSESQLSKCFSGARQLKAEEADAARRFLGYRLPHDPADPLEQGIQRRLASLDAVQKRQVVLYLEALAGAFAEPDQATEQRTKSSQG